MCWPFKTMTKKLTIWNLGKEWVYHKIFKWDFTRSWGKPEKNKLSYFLFVWNLHLTSICLWKELEMRHWALHIADTVKCLERKVELKWLYLISLYMLNIFNSLLQSNWWFELVRSSPLLPWWKCEMWPIIWNTFSYCFVLHHQGFLPAH